MMDLLTINLTDWLQAAAGFLPLLIFALLIFFMTRAAKGRPGTTPPDKYDQLKKIAELRDAGILDEREFQHEKQKLLSRTE